MILPLLLALLPLVSGEIHRLKLQKLPAAVGNPDLESLYLAEKYGAPPQAQKPILNAGRFSRPSIINGEQTFWTQEDLKGGHKVPLTSMRFR